jgi:hypothetical protein
VSIEEWSEHIGKLIGLTLKFREEPSAFGGLPIDTTHMHAMIGATKVDWRDGIKRMIQALTPQVLKLTE